MAEANREEAEKACRRAEELFLAGNVAGARRLAGRAQQLFPSLPGIANALAAYDVHAAAAAAANPDRACGPDWHAVLGVDRHATGDAVRKQFRRRSLLVHPDKNRSAAAEGAFKLLRQACDALSADHDRSAAAAAATDWWRSHTAKYPAAKAPTPPPARRHASKPTPRKEPSTAPSPAKPSTFPCPAQCPQCGAQFTSMVSAGPWKLRCKACSKSIMVNVQGLDAATYMRTTTS